MRSTICRVSILSMLAAILSPSLSQWSIDEVAAASELRLAGPVSGLDSLDPAISRDLSTNAVLRQVFRGLVAFDDELRPVPELAAEITSSPDGMTYAIRLRDDATFHDGSPIEAADVAYSLARAVSPATAGGDVSRLGGPTFLGAIKGFDDVVAGDATALSGVVVVDPTTLDIELTAPQSTFVMRLASVPASVVDREQLERDAEWASRPNGSGPFRVAEWRPQQELTLDAFDGYPSGPPGVDRVRFRLGADALQSTNLFQAGEIDIDEVSPLDAEAITALQASLGGTVVETPAFTLTYLAFRTDVAPLDDIHVRRALQLAFPRERVATVALGGNAVIAQGIIPDGMLGVTWAAGLPAFDLEAARAELARSRYGSAEAVPPVRLDVSGSYAAEAFLEAVETGLGIDVEIVQHDPDTFFEGLADGAYMAHELTWGADFPDPETFLSSLFGGSSPDNYIGYRDADVDRLLDQASRSLDEGARAAAYAEAQQLILDDSVVIPLFHDIRHTLIRDGVSGVQETPMGILRLETVTVDE